MTDPIRFFWFIPTYGDGPYLGSTHLGRSADFPYLKEVAQAVDRLGYEGVLLPTGQNCEESWVTATGLAAVTEQLKYLVALRPGVVLPAYAARQTAALDRLSRGRLLLNVVVGGNPTELAGDGVFTAHNDRYAQAAEFLTVWRRLLAGETVDFDGKFYRVEAGRLDFPPVQTPYPPLYLGGSSEAGIDLTAEQIDTYLTWGEPVAQVKEKLDIVRARAAAKGRTVRFGIRLHFIVRETEDEAWAAAEKLISKISDEQIAAAQARFTKQMDSVGQRRMAELHGGDRGKLVVGPNLWAGVGLVRGGAGTSLVGTPRQIADRLAEYQEAGAELVIGSGYPHLEEAYRVAELLFPVLGIERNALGARATVANEFAVGFHGKTQLSAAAG